MSDSRAKRAWKSARRLFRWFRIAALSFFLLLAGFLFYWNQAGLPDFIKNALLAELRNRGIELSFHKARFHWDRGIVAEQVNFGHALLVSGPQLIVDELQIGVSPGDLLKGHLVVDRLRMRGGKWIWHFAGTNQPAVPLVVEKVQADLLLHKTMWDLQSLQGRFHGADFKLAGVVSNAPFLSELWEKTNSLAMVSSNRWPPAATDAALRQFAEHLKAWNLEGNPTVALKFGVDATNPAVARLDLELRAGQAATPYGEFKNLALTTHLTPDHGTNNRAMFSLEATVGGAHTPWGDGAELVVRSQGETAWGSFWRTNFSAHITGRQLATRWGKGRHLALDLTLTASQTNVLFSGENLETAWGKAAQGRGGIRWHAAAGNGRVDWELDAVELAVPLAGIAQQARIKAMTVLDAARLQPRLFTAEITLRKPVTEWGKAADATLAVSVTMAHTNWWPWLQNTNLLVWDRLAGLQFRWEAQLTNITAPSLELARVDTAGAWRAPGLAVEKFDAHLYGGRITVAGDLDAGNRHLAATVDAGFNYHKLVPLLPPSACGVLTNLVWERPPDAHGHFSLVLPAWTNRAPNWELEVLPTLELDARLNADGCAYKGFAAREFQTSLTYSNRHLRLPDLHWQNGTDQVWLDWSHQPDGSFLATGRSLANPERFRSLLPTNALNGLALAKLTAPPWCEATVRGNLAEPKTIRVEALVRATNITFREVQIDRLETRVRWADNVLTFNHPLIERPEGRGEADLVVADFNRQLIFLTNAQGRLEPDAVARAIGPHVRKTLAPYQFAEPPQAKAEGVIPMHGNQDARMRFDVAGGPFAWWRFKVTNVMATVLWTEETVAITNLLADFYHGRLVGELLVDFTPTNYSVLSLTANVSDVQLRDLARDINDHTNKLEGLLLGRLVVTRAVLEDWTSWQGYGNAELRDGLIWDAPVFGIFSPVLNKISPGLGNTRAHKGAATFTITNSVIRSDDLEIKTGSTTLKYEGTVDFEYQINARVEAEVFRQTTVVGPVLNLVLKPFTKLFEYKVTGTLADPKLRPLFVPKILVSPFKTIKGWFKKDEPPPTAPDSTAKPPTK